MEGLLNIGKRRGVTSFQVVQKVRRLTGERRVGHTGTLDRAASGVLVLLVGRATKLMRFLVEDEKEYVGTVVLGEATDTDDSTGRVVQRGELTGITHSSVEDVLRTFMGSTEQLPPAYSCVRVGGRRMHELARKGWRVDAPPRRVEIKELELLDYRGSELEIRVVCSKGTYMRALARDIGSKLGCFAHLHNLVRLRVGEYSFENSIDIDGVRGIEEHVIGMNEALGKYPAVTIDDEAVLRVRNGGEVELPGGVAQNSGGMVRVCGRGGILVAAAAVEGSTLVPIKVLG